MQSLDLDNCPTPIASDFLIEQELPTPTFSFGLTSIRFPPGLAQCLLTTLGGGFGGDCKINNIYLVGDGGPGIFGGHGGSGNGGGYGSYGGHNGYGGDGESGGFGGTQGLGGDGKLGGCGFDGGYWPAPDESTY